MAAERSRMWAPATLERQAWLFHLPASWNASEVGTAGPADTDARPSDRAIPSPRSPAVEDLRSLLGSALDNGPGLAVLRGLPLDGLTDQACAELGRSVLSLLGTPRPLESVAPMDHLLTAVRTRGDAPRGPVEEAALAAHTDRAGPPGPPRLLALLCVRPAPKGGESLLISGHTVHARLSVGRPATLPTLYGDFHFGAERHLTRTGPVFDRTDGRLATRYNRYQIDRGHEAAGEPLTAAQVEALDAVDDVLGDGSLSLRLPLRRGDLLLLDNNAVLHGRTAYTDHPDPLRSRCLTRAWAD